MAEYVPRFDGQSDVLDIGCGRGEFLELLKARGVTARGVDTNHEMVEVCRAHGLDVTEDDALRLLMTLDDSSVGGIFAAQVVEHLQPRYLMRLLDTAAHKMRPGGVLVLETINPACWLAFFESFVRDVTHVWPLHPETLQYLTEGERLPRRRDRVPVAGGRNDAAAPGAGLAPGRRTHAGRARRDVQRQRDEAQFPPLRVPGLRDHRATLTKILVAASAVRVTFLTLSWSNIRNGGAPRRARGDR